MSFVAKFAIFSFCFAFVNTDKTLKFYQEKNIHEAQDLTDNDIRNLSNLSDMKHFKAVLKEILIPRVVGSENHKKVGDYIVTQMSNLGWNIEEDTFVDRTPVFGNLNFRNIITTLNPNADRYLVLACHYDSKYTREHTFVGATDSAVPCAQMINLAKVMAPQLEKLKNARLSLMFIFFDGEEAFRQWGPTDSIYGARHLAEHWHQSHFKDGASNLQRIDVLVLLDLLGAPDPVFYSYFQATEKWYVRLAAAEQRLAELDQLQSYSKGKAEQTYFRLRSSGAFIEDDHIPFLRRITSTEKWYVRLAAAEQRLAELDQLQSYSKGKAEQTYFRLRSSGAFIEDDHIPFLRRNVDILHLIPTPFPSVWHTAADDRSALDFHTIDNLNKILRVFVAEYLHTKP